jgi:flagellar biosynthesis/type III secretory pathway chaperone
MTNKPPLQKILKEILLTEDKNKHNNKRTGNIKPQERTSKYSESSIELAAHTKILKQQNQVNGRKHHIPLNINTEC